MNISRNTKEVYPPQLLAQRLNNRAADCIEVGQYEVAAATLIKALKLSERPTPRSAPRIGQESDEDDMVLTDTSCDCHYCSLDYCMTYSQQHNDSVSSEDQQQHQCLDCSPCGEGGYIYQQPIRVNPRAIEEGHCMGIVLPLILTFNLALAHHLSALQAPKISRAKLQRVLRLYELAYRWQMEEEDAQVDSIRFTMIIANNLSEIHRAVSNHDKHQKCLQHLLSTLMFVVDCHENERNAMDMDGFLRNTSELILHSRCAGAA
jgi:hypothetical protein